MHPLRLLVLAGWLGLAMGGCATPQNPDPWEPMNRKIFAFNETVDIYAIEPAAKAWDFILPGFAETGIRNFFDNVGMPIVFANDVLQAKPKAAVWDVLRFVYNTTFGIAGFIDIATMVQMPKNDEDFGQTLGYWGVPPGPFLVVPFLGPFTIRDGTGAVVDSVAAPQGWFIPIWASVAARAVELLNLRAIYLVEIAESRADAFDYYAFLRNAYLQNRRAKIADQTDTPALDEEDLYYFDEEDEDYDDEEDYDDVGVEIEEEIGEPAADDSGVGDDPDATGDLEGDPKDEAGEERSERDVLDKEQIHGLE